MKSELKEFYNKKSLSTEKLDTLVSLQKELKDSKKKKLFPIAAGLVAASLLIFSLVQLNSKPLSERIIAEVVYNHNKDMPPEVLTKDYDMINEALDKLDFKVIPSQRITAKYQLIGGRYCSIQGKIAAQLKLFDKASNKRVTLYQFIPGNKTIAAEGAKDGTQVTIWHEGDVSFALAK